VAVNLCIFWILERRALLEAFLSWIFRLYSGKQIMSADELSASFGLGIPWAVYLAIITGVALWKANVGFSVELETNEQLFLGLPNKRETTAQKISRTLIWVGACYGFVQVLALSFVKEVSWPATDFNISLAASYVSEKTPSFKAFCIFFHGQETN
jgi:hypothetical protein